MILAVVVAYGETPQLPRLVEGLASVPDCRTILVENRRGTVHPWLGPPGVEVLAGHPNVGYGTAVNLAVSAAMKAGPPPEWLVVSNSDVALPYETRLALPELLKVDADVVGFRVVDTENRPARSTTVLPDVRTTRYAALRGEEAVRRRWPHRRYPIGAFFAVRMDAFLRVGGFDPRFWMYFEETDLFTRLHADGARIHWLTDAFPIVHRGAGTTGRNPMLQAELGRSAALYAQLHRPTLGRAWAPTYAASQALLAARKTLAGQPAEASRALRILTGFAAGIARPDWEPAVRSRWRAAPVDVRRRVGRLPKVAPTLERTP